MAGTKTRVPRRRWGLGAGGKAAGYLVACLAWSLGGGTLIAAASVPTAVADDQPVVSVTLPARDTERAVPIGTAQLPSFGRVQFVAERSGGRMVVRAIDGTGTTIGRADFPVGLKQAPIHLAGPGGRRAVTLSFESTDTSDSAGK